MEPLDALTDDAFGHWLAGLIDGEGSFLIRGLSGGQRQGYAPRMQLALRADDGPMLEAVQRRTGLGSLYYDSTVYGSQPNAKPQVRWIVFTKRDCIQLVACWTATH